jgi:AcrR family transcriptional regulator
MAISDPKCRKNNSREELHNRILQEAKRLFMSNGIKVITMDRIAASLTISKRTLYEEFPDKETLVMEVVKQVQCENEVMFSKVYEESDNVLQTILRIYYLVLQMVRDIHKDYFFDLKRYPSVNKMHEENKLRDRNKVVTFFQKGVFQGLFRGDMNYEIVNVFLEAQLEALKKSEITEKYPFNDVFDTLIFTFLRGIATDKGLLLIEKYKSDYFAGSLKP